MIKSSLVKLEIDFDPIQIAQESGFELLDYSAADAMTLKEMPFHHKDSFDRMLISQALNRKFKIMLTMLIGRLWHGANWTFVVWGGLHGLYLIIERILSKKFKETEWLKNNSTKILLALFTYLLVNLTWVFFRAQSFPQAFELIQSMFGLNPDAQSVLATVYIIEAIVVTVCMLIIHWRMRNTSLENVVQKTPWFVTGTIWGIMLILIIISQGSGDAFIYFQF